MTPFAPLDLLEELIVIEEEEIEREEPLRWTWTQEVEREELLKWVD